MENSNKESAIGEVTCAEAMKNLEEEEFMQIWNSITRNAQRFIRKTKMESMQKFL